MRTQVTALALVAAVIGVVIALAGATLPGGAMFGVAATVYAIARAPRSATR